MLKAAASAWRGAGSEAMSCLRRAVELAPPGATVWFEALSELVSATAPWGLPPDDWVAALRDGRPADEQGSAAVAGWSRAAT